jgi:hypothetical protein
MYGSRKHWQIRENPSRWRMSRQCTCAAHQRPLVAMLNEEMAWGNVQSGLYQESKHSWSFQCNVDHEIKPRHVQCENRHGTEISPVYYVHWFCNLTCYGYYRCTGYASESHSGAHIIWPDLVQYSRSAGYEEYCFLGWNAVYSGRYLRTF